MVQIWLHYGEMLRNDTSEKIYGTYKIYERNFAADVDVDSFTEINFST